MTQETITLILMIAGIPVGLVLGYLLISSEWFAKLTDKLFF